MTRPSDRETGSTVLSLEMVAKFAMANELRLVSSKLDRLYAEIEKHLPLLQEYYVRFKNMNDATQELKSAKKLYKKIKKCTTKTKNTNTKNPKKHSIGSISTLKSRPKFWKKLKNYFESLMKTWAEETPID
jgi:hypothetical protein